MCRPWCSSVSVPANRIATSLKDVLIRGRSEHHCFELAIYVTDTLVPSRLVDSCLFSRCDQEDWEQAGLFSRAAPGFETYLRRQEIVLKLISLRSGINTAAVITSPWQAVCEERPPHTRRTNTVHTDPLNISFFPDTPTSVIHLPSGGDRFVLLRYLLHQCMLPFYVRNDHNTTTGPKAVMDLLPSHHSRLTMFSQSKRRRAGVLRASSSVC